MKKPRGFPELRRRFRGWGALRVSAGTPKKRTVKKLDAMLVGLGYAGRYDYLALIRDRVLTPLQLLEHLRGRDLGELPPADGFTRLTDTREAWIAALRCTESHRVNVRHHLKRLLALSPDARGNDLPTLLKRLKAADEERGAFRSFNYARACVLAYLRDHGGQAARVYLEAKAVPVLPTARRRQGHPCTPAEAWTIREALGAVWGPVWAAMCATGMGPAELWGAWEPADGGLHVHGTKRAGRDRLVPLLWAPERPPFNAPHGPAMLRKAMARLGAVQPYDGRRTYARLLADAGLNTIDQDALMGHGAKGMTQLYQRGNLAPRLAELADALRAVAGRIGEGP